MNDELTMTIELSPMEAAFVLHRLDAPDCIAEVLNEEQQPWMDLAVAEEAHQLGKQLRNGGRVTLGNLMATEVFVEAIEGSVLMGMAWGRRKKHPADYRATRTAARRLQKTLDAAGLRCGVPGL